ncbi:hypothetical protein BDR03DRAFT_1017726 [Suillus americanus]|nr:hypothetical protein BDR03DRAFT_1017726 [Suillus americanus]
MVGIGGVFVMGGWYIFSINSLAALMMRVSAHTPLQTWYAGTTIKTDGEDSGPYVFLSILNIGAHNVSVIPSFSAASSNEDNARTASSEASGSSRHDQVPEFKSSDYGMQTKHPRPFTTCWASQPSS